MTNELNRTCAIQVDMVVPSYTYRMCESGCHRDERQKAYAEVTITLLNHEPVTVHRCESCVPAVYEKHRLALTANLRKFVVPLVSEACIKHTNHAFPSPAVDAIIDVLTAHLVYRPHASDATPSNGDVSANEERS